VWLRAELESLLHLEKGNTDESREMDSKDYDNDASDSHDGRLVNRQKTTEIGSSGTQAHKHGGETKNEHQGVDNGDSTNLALRFHLHLFMPKNQRDFNPKPQTTLVRHGLTGPHENDNLPNELIVARGISGRVVVATESPH